jgi:hypothetical protein
MRDGGKDQAEETVTTIRSDAVHLGVTEESAMAMRRTTPTHDIVSASSPVRSLVREMLSLYADWREDALAVGDACLRWSSAPRAQEPWRFSAYMAALDQEESSARSYRMAIAELKRLAPLRSISA